MVERQATGQGSVVWLEARDARDTAATRRVAEGLAGAVGAVPRALSPRRRSQRAVAAQLAREAEAADARLIVVAGGGHGSLGTALFGGLAHRLAVSATCPVVVLPQPAIRHADGPWRSDARSLVCGIDRSEESLSVARTAATLAAGLGDELVLLHTLRDEAGFGHAEQDPATAHVERTLLQVGGRGFVQAVQPVLGLCTLAARCEARLLVIGARRLGRLSLLAGRSVSTVLTSVADRPVVLVPEASMGAEGVGVLA